MPGWDPTTFAKTYQVCEVSPLLMDYPSLCDCGGGESRCGGLGAASWTLTDAVIHPPAAWSPVATNYLLTPICTQPRISTPADPAHLHTLQHPAAPADPPHLQCPTLYILHTLQHLQTLQHPSHLQHLQWPTLYILKISLIWSMVMPPLRSRSQSSQY